MGNREECWIFIGERFISLGIRKARDFLRNMTKAFATSCVNYYDVTDEFPFIFRERQIKSVLFPAIAKVADAVFMEQPIRRGIRFYCVYN